MTLVTRAGKGSALTWAEADANFNQCGLALNQTAAEVTAGVTPTNYSYPPGDVRRYGAVGDGVTDDSTAFANAALVSGTYPIILTHTTYLVNTPFVLPSGGSIFSDSRQAVIKTTVAGNHIVSATSSSNITLYSITLQGANSYTQSTFSIGGFQAIDTGLATFANCTNVRVYDCEFSTFPVGVSCLQCNKVFVTHNYCHNWFYYGILGSLSTEASFDFNVMDTSDCNAVVLFTGAPNAGATSATLATAWGYTTGVYGVSFIETASGTVRELRGVTLTNGQTTATWSTALVNNCNAQTNGNSYGISITGNEAGGVPTKGCSISFNRIWNVPSWDGIMSHDINGLTIVGNDIRNVRTGIDLSLFTNTFDRNLSIANNYIEATTQDLWNGVAASSSGIILDGASSTITFTGAPLAGATSATLNASWSNETGLYIVQFTETSGGLFELRKVTLTNGATTATWNAGLGVNCNAGATAVFAVDTVTVTGNIIRNFGNMATSTGYGAPSISNAGVMFIGEVNDLTITGNIIEGTGAQTGASVGGYVGIYMVGRIFNATITGNQVNGSNDGGGIRSVGLVCDRMTLNGNIIYQTSVANNSVQLGNTTQINNLSLGENPTNSATPYTTAGTITLAPISLSTVVLPTGTATVEPLLFVSGTNLTTAVAGAQEYDGTCQYFSPAASSRAVSLTEYVQVISSPYTLTSQTAAQKLLNATANGAVTLPVGTYDFECSFSLTSLNTGTSSVFGFALGGAATFTQSWWAYAAGAALATPNTLQGTFNTAANVALVSANTTGVGYAIIKGTIRVTVAGTVIPQVSLNTAAAAVVGSNSYFRAWPVGNGTVTNVGNWS